MPQLFLGPTGSADDAFPHNVCELLSKPTAALPLTVRTSPLYNAILRYRETEQSSAHSAPTRPIDRPKEMPLRDTVTVPLSVARRGLGPRDPLVQRKLKRQQQEKKKQQQEQQDQQQEEKKDRKEGGEEEKEEEEEEKEGKHISEQSATCAGHSVKHWSRRLLKEMTPTGWDVFREQVGIQLEIVSRRPLSNSNSNSISHSISNSNSISHSLRFAPDMTRPIRCWAEAGLPLALGTIVSKRFPLPSPIQSQCVPMALRGSLDVLAVAETGSGKTAAYLIPVLAEIIGRCPQLLGNSERIAHGPFALVAVPTRELAEQITREALAIINGVPFEELCRLEDEEEENENENEKNKNNNNNNNRNGSEENSKKEDQSSEVHHHSNESTERNRLRDIRVVKIIGGERMEDQFESLSRGAHIVVGTLGQLDALLQQRMLALGNTRLVVLDEADRMIEEKQTDVLVAVLERCPIPRRTFMFTATLPPLCEDIALKYFSPDGYIVVRVPLRCAGITQVMEFIPSDPTAVPTQRSDTEKGPTGKSHILSTHTPNKEGEKIKAFELETERDSVLLTRGLNALHSVKFARLVSYLCYATPPVVVFANEKRTCDALQTALRAEAERLAGLLDSFSLSALVGDIPLALQPQQSQQSQQYGRRRAVGGISILRSVAVVHSELTQTDRRRVLELFHRGERQVLVTTDLLARGLDVPNVSLVINYDMPRVDARHSSSEEAVRKYIHRIGRTGRAGASGVAVSFLSLPAARVQRAQQHVQRNNNNKNNNADNNNSMGGGKGIFISERAATRVADINALIGNGRNRETDNNSLMLSDTERAKEEEEEDDEYDEDGDGDDEGDEGQENDEKNEKRRGEPPRSRARVEVSDFPNDEALLPPLWEFLTKCAEANGAVNGAEAIQQQRCKQLQLPQALVALMMASTRRSTSGAITQ